MKKGEGYPDPQDGKRKMEVREYYLHQNRDFLNLGGSSTENIVFADEVANEVVKKPSNGMIWLFEKDKGRFFQSLNPVLPQHSEVNETFWGSHNLSGEMVEEALNVCEETYEGSHGNPQQPAGEWQRGNLQSRFLCGGTRCVKRLKGDTLYIGFRGSASEIDWKDNSYFSLTCFEGVDGTEKVHEGFKERAANMFMGEVNLISHLPQDLPEKIVLTGHSLGAAISQVVYMQFQQAVMEQRKLAELKCKVLNITFATPLVGNLPLRNKMMEGHKNLAENAFHFVLEEDIVPSVLFYKHAYERIPRPSKAAQLVGIDKRFILWKILSSGFSLENLPPEAFHIEIPSMYEQPVYDEESQEAMEPYAPMGNYFYIKQASGNARLHKLASNEDPQYVAQALVSTLNVLRGIGSLDFFVGKSIMRIGASKVPLANRSVDKVHPLLTKIIEGHALSNYKHKIVQLLSGNIIA